MDDMWDCEAYGPEGIDVGALCFLAEQGERACATRVECRLVMHGARQQLFSRIHELAAAGDPTGIDLASAFTSPDQLLGGAG